MSSQSQSNSHPTSSSHNMDATSSNSPLLTLDGILAGIIATPAPQPAVLAHLLRTCAPRDVRDNILCGTTSTGADPLLILDVGNPGHTVGVLYILAARLASTTIAPPAISYIESFCRSFDPAAARCAADRVTLVAQGILHISEASNKTKYALQPIYDLITRFAPPNTLTALHSIFLRACIVTGNQTLALPLLAVGPLSPPLPSSPSGKELLDTLSYTDHLTYHYTAGFALATLHHWPLACDFLETVVAAPSLSGAVSALQLEAFKKLTLIQLIHTGAAPLPPKYTAPLLARLLQTSPYGAFAKAYPGAPSYLAGILENERALFDADRNTGLMKLALGRVPRWNVRRLEGTYASIGLAEAGAKVGLDEAGVVAAVLDLVEAGEINARIDPPGVLTFSSSPAGNKARTRGEVDRALREAETHAVTLKRLEMELARSRDYLSKAVRNREEPNWGAVEEDMMFAPGERGMASFADDAMYS
ncbi:hypothetical protein FIBSPDRAFT_1050759 [Athelia psychrophila]|uniref:COP9 signalosome complex subunit 3 N-terminal helical repeats domain-containing protein n=1 Tax=Athelia psychrophila TaxID=1759441 RepID=A0A166AAV8_9AGAM|nr:hypothetical protein FIBSPDRAFT_1050759 [Fibularhizoctonia sp. CBS 109695]